MIHITPYIHFNGSTQKAMEFYKNVLGGELELFKIGESPLAETMPPEMHDQVFHANLKNDRINIMASDIMPPKTNHNYSGISLALGHIDEEDTKRIFNLLSEKGEIILPLEITFWAALYGQLKDQFGIYWDINCQLNK